MRDTSQGRHVEIKPGAQPRTRRNGIPSRFLSLLRVLPRLIFWYLVLILFTAMWFLARLVVSNVNSYFGPPRKAEATTMPVESLADRYREEKRRRRAEAMDEWASKWATLEPAAQRTTVDHEAMDPPWATVPADDSSDLRRALLARLHSDLLTVHKLAKLQEARIARDRDLAHSLLAGDPRTMWAWIEYRKQKHVLPASSQDARQILEAIPAGDHVEIFTAVTMSKGKPKRKPNTLPLNASLAARTFGCWILPSRSAKAAETILDAEGRWLYARGGSMVDPVAEVHFTLTNGVELVAYPDKLTYTRFHHGVGQFILRLPDSNLAPLPPRRGTGLPRASTEAHHTQRLLQDWQSAEDVALWHMSGPLAFFGAKLTGGVTDRGIDVEHPKAVAQVKMQANPVGSPQIRQLRGTRPNLPHHIFYSTSGYTRAAITEAAETALALFTIDEGGAVHPHGTVAKQLILDGHIRHGGDDALVADYIRSVTERIHKARANYVWSALREAFPDNKGRLSRAESYLEGAVEALKRHPKLGSDTHKAIISHFRNADLRAAFFCQVLDLPYPGDEPLGDKKHFATADDFY